NTLVAFANDTAVSGPGTIGLRVGQGASVDNFSADVIILTNPVLPFTDNFNAATNQQLSSNWLERLGNFKVTGGNATGQAALNIATVNGVSAANVFAEVDIALATGQFVGLVARYTGPGDSNMYMAALS